MEYRLVPFTALMNREDSTMIVATQMQKIVDTQVSQGWEYSHADSVQTFVKPAGGCFGFGGQPGYMTAYNILVFKKA